MKKTYIIIVLVLLSINSFAQAPNWDWARSAAGSNYDSGNSVATDAWGNVYVVGSFLSSTIVFGADTLYNAGSYDIYIVKYDASGNVLWAKSAGGSNDDEAFSLAIDNNGNVFVTGVFYSPTIVFGNDTLTNFNNANFDIYLVKYSPTGTIIWARSAGGSGDERGYSVATDAVGNVFVTGIFTSPTLVFGTTALTNTGTNNMYIVMYDTTGTVLWAKSEGGTGNIDARSVAIDANGNIYVTGSFANQNLVFGSTTLINVGGYDTFLVKYNSAGTVLWAKSGGGSSIDEGQSVATDASNNVYVTGYFESTTIVFSTTTLTNTNTNTNALSLDMFIAKYNSSGTVLWAKNAGGTLDDRGTSVTTDATGNVYVLGNFDSPSIAVGSTTLINNDNTANFSDLFLIKYSSTGTALWAKNAGGTYDDGGNSVTTDTWGNVYITGVYGSSSIAFGSTTFTNVAIGDENMFLAKIAGPLGINENNNESTFTIAPNPFTSQTTISFNEEQKSTSIKITDVLGKEIKTINFSGKQCTIEKGEMLPGIYFLQVVDSQKNIVNRKIVVQ